MRRGLIAAGAALAVVAVGAAAATVPGLVRDDGPGAARPSAPVAGTVAVAAGRVVMETTVPGTLLFPSLGPVSAPGPGVLTWLPDHGRVLRPGDVAATVGAQPVVVLRGSVPAYRTFERGMPDGVDVLQLEQGLAALGRFDGDVDEHFSVWTARAVRAWQRALGVRATGRLERTAVLFVTRDLRVGARRTRVGSVVAPNTPLYDATATRRVVRADVDLDDQALARPGRRVTVRLPTGSGVRGRVVRVGDPVERDGADGVAVKLPATVRLARTRDSFQRAQVKVTFETRSRRERLTVPVDALVALGPDRFGVEVPTRGGSRRVPVRLGRVSAGRVVVTGRGVRAGVRVVVPAR